MRIHGDFNTNNIIYDAGRDAVHFIDVHRSGPGDYALDIGVFVVSNLRNPIQNVGRLDEVQALDRLMVEGAAEFAREVRDAAFPTRLELSQARSFITSARLVTDPAFARRLYVRGIQLLDDLTARSSL